MKIALFLILLVLLCWLGWGAWHTGSLPPVGGRAPNFALSDQNGTLQRLETYSGRWLALYFYPKDDTPGCTAEACSLRDGIHQLSASNISVVGVSVDKQQSHQEFARKYRLPFPLLADTEGSVARRYGVLMDWGVFRMSRRVTFLINPEGNIHKVYQDVNPDTHADQILSGLR